MLGNYYICDIESYKALQYFCFYSPERQEWREFEISEFKNEIYSFIKFYSDSNIDYLITFNGISYDQPILEWVYRNHEDWYNLTGKEICRLIYQYSQDRIDNSNHKIACEFKDTDFKIKPIDLFKIWHFDREQRSCSLKKLEFSMDFPNIEELPLDFRSEYLSPEEISQIELYCKNDILATKQFLQYTLGNCENSLYKGDNKIETRFTLSEEFGVNLLNASDTKIGDEITQIEYCKAAGITRDKLPRKGFFRKSIPIKYCIPKHIKFETKELNNFLERIRKMELKQNEDFSEVLDFGGQTYDFKKGGLHNRISGKIYHSDNQSFIGDYDGTGFYPRLILNNGYYPYHLKKDAFLKALGTIVSKREELKPLAKKDSKIKGVVQGLKISANSVFGKSSDPYSWMMDKMLTMQTTITGELSLLMLIEAYNSVGIECIMSNSDGVSILANRSKEAEIERINRWWMETTRVNLEETRFKFVAFSTVNDYIGLKDNGESKFKGDLLQDSELHGDKSRKIVRIALSKYFLENIPVEDTIRNHKNIYDYTIGVKSSSKYHYELLNPKTSNRRILKKMVRYYISTNGDILLKVKNEGAEAKGNDEAHCESSSRVNEQYQPLVTYFNTFEQKDDYQIDYEYYILQAKALLYKIERGKKLKAPKSFNKGQISMF